MTRQELDHHLELRKQLLEVRELLTMMEGMAAPRSVKWDGMPHTKSAGDPVGELAAEIADLKGRIRDLEMGVAESEDAVEAFIRTITDDRTRIIFRLRFQRGFEWKEVATVMGKWATTYTVKNTCYRYLDSRDMRR